MEKKAEKVANVTKKFNKYLKAKKEEIERELYHQTRA